MRFLFTVVVLILICIPVSSQNNFAEIEREVDIWFQSVVPMSAIETKVPKSIDFSNYSINGIVAKGVLREGTTVKFYNTKSLVPELLLEGRVSYNAGRLVIKGIRHLATSNGTNKIYGTFYVYNMDDFTMSLKPKKAGDLRIKNSLAYYYVKGFYHDRPFIIRMRYGNNTVYLGRKNGGNSFNFLSARVPNVTINEDNSIDIYQILLRAKEDVTMCWDNGTTFKGVIKTTPIRDSIIAFSPLEGQKTNVNMGQYKAHVSREKGNIIVSQDYDTGNKLLSNETWFVKDDGSISEDDFWNFKKILEHCYLAKWKFRNGNYFEGSIKYVVTLNEDSISATISATATKGVFKYPNGDRFEGDVSSKSVGPFFVDGTTYFSDGSRANGNWLEKFKLSNEQWQEVYSCASPSKARELAQKLMQRNNFPEYEYSGILTYFDPSTEEQKLCGSYVVYDKAKKQYICKYTDSEKTRLVFAVDSKGCRKWEIVYKDGKPAYINEFSWYSNGVIESIKSYSYTTRKIYLSCHFYSDGKLRSAYQYGRGNNGENTLRKSKESHPTYGGYTCKLYDLNGYYERSIEWGIGEGESLFGGRYNQKMAPDHLVLGELKPVAIFE